jgi:hypothetical protein
MRRELMGAVVVGLAICWACPPGVAHAGWITLSAGASGNTQPTAGSEFWYGSPSTPWVAVDQLTGAGSVTAATGGGTVFFTGLGAPVVLNLSDGSAYLAGGSLPSGVTDRGPGGDPAGPPASAAPQAGGQIPPDAALLGLSIAAPGTDGTRVLTVSISDGVGAALGSGTLAIPDGGWWVIGLGPGQQPAPNPLPDPGPTPTPDPTPVPSPAPGVPEPTTVALVASGVVLVLPWLRRKRCRTAS